MLFREDLEWLNRGYTERQLDLIVFLAVAESINKAKRVRKGLEESKEDGVLKRLVNIKLFLAAAESYLELNSKKLESIKDWEFRFDY